MKSLHVEFLKISIEFPQLSDETRFPHLIKEFRATLNKLLLSSFIFVYLRRQCCDRKKWVRVMSLRVKIRLIYYEVFMKYLAIEKLE
jgi:hypothetical protein